MNLLIEKAKEIKSQRTEKELSKEEIELGVSWAMEEVTLTQVTKVMGIKFSAGSYVFLARALKAHINNLNKLH